MQEFVGKTAVITGGASGIGLAMGELFAEQGMNIVLADIEAEALDKAVATVREHGAKCISVVTDVSQANAVEQLADAALAEFGAIHIACNNAGVFAGGLLWEESLADYEWQMDVNLWGVIHGIRSFIPRMIAQDCECHMVNTASMAAVTSMPYSGIYHLTKHAVLAMSESLYHELSFHAPSIGVSVLCPEAIRTGIGQSERNRPERYSGEGNVVLTPERDMVMGALAESVDGGIPPRVMAERVFSAIQERQFYILSDDAWRRSAEQRLDDIRHGRNPTFAPPIEE